MANGLEALAKTLLGGDSLTGISSKANASSDDVSQVLAAALPLLLKGADKQSTGAKTADSFVQALSSHSKDKTSDLASFFQNVDAEDGAKIVGHLLGNSTSTADKISKKSGVDAEKAMKILAVAAPLFMSLLGKKTKTESKKDKESSTASIASALLKSVDAKTLLSAFLK